VYFFGQCVEVELELLARLTVEQINVLVGFGLLVDEPPVATCGSIIIEVTAISKPAADKINDAIRNGLLNITLQDGTVLEAIHGDETTTTIPAASKSLSPGGIAGVVGGALVCVLVAILLVCMYWCKGAEEGLSESWDNHAVGTFAHRNSTRRNTRKASVKKKKPVFTDGGWSDFDDDIEIGKLTNNPLSRKRGGNKNKENANQSLDDVWGIDEERTDGVTAVVNRDSLFQIWGTDMRADSETDAPLHEPDLMETKFRKGMALPSGGRLINGIPEEARPEGYLAVGGSSGSTYNVAVAHDAVAPMRTAIFEASSHGDAKIENGVFSF
jgi:hypothetical protein